MDAGSSDLGSLMRLQLYVGMGCCQLKASLGLEGLFPGWCTCMSGASVLAVGRRPQFLFMWSSPQDGSYIVVSCL